MKTHQKTKYLIYLLIGVLTNAFISCKKITEYRSFTEWVFVNNSKNTITIKSTFEAIIFNPNETKIMNWELEGPKTINKMSLGETYIGYKIGREGDVNYENQKCEKFSKSKFSDITKYKFEQISNNRVKYTFIITQQQIDSVANCK